LRMMPTATTHHRRRSTSDLRLLRQSQRIISLDAWIPHNALQFGVPEQ
jgi:hypothetical protein